MSMSLSFDDKAFGTKIDVFKVSKVMKNLKFSVLFFFIEFSKLWNEYIQRVESIKDL